MKNNASSGYQQHEALMERAARALAQAEWWLDETPEEAKIRLETLRSESILLSERTKERIGRSRTRKAV